MGLDDLTKQQVDDTITYCLINKYDKDVDAFLNDFKDILEKLFQASDYRSTPWDDRKANDLLANYRSRTDAVKQDYRDKKIVKVTGSTAMTLGGFLMFFPPLLPIGCAAVGAGTLLNAGTEIAELTDKHLQEQWLKAKNDLFAFVQNPLKDYPLGPIYQLLLEKYDAVEGKVSRGDFTVIIQALGWNYFLFRREGKSAQEALQMLHKVLELFATRRYVITDELRQKNEEAIEDIQQQVMKTAELSGLEMAGTLAMIGISAGISAGLLMLSQFTAGLAVTFADALTTVLVRLSNFALRTFKAMKTLAPGMVIVAGLVSLVMNSVALANIDETFQPYYDFYDVCQKRIGECKTAYNEVETAVSGMMAFMNNPHPEA